MPMTLKLSIATLPVPPHATPAVLSWPSQRNSPMFIEDAPLAFTVSPTNLSTLTTAELLAESDFEPSVLFMFNVPPDAETAEPAIYSIEEFTVRTPSPDLENEPFPPLAIESLPAVPSPIVTAGAAFDVDGHASLVADVGEAPVLVARLSAYQNPVAGYNRVLIISKAHGFALRVNRAALAVFRSVNPVASENRVRKLHGGVFGVDRTALADRGRHGIAREYRGSRTGAVLVDYGLPPLSFLTESAPPLPSPEATTLLFSNDVSPLNHMWPLLFI